VIVRLKLFLVLLVLAACAGNDAETARDADSSRVTPQRPLPHDAPRIVLISIDTLRPDRLGCYGNVAPTSPTLDGWREGAVLFETAVAQAPSTLPSHATMFSSLLPAHHGASWSRRTGLPSTIPTLTTELKAAGYRTAAFTGGGQIAPEFGLDRGFDLYGVDVGGSDFEAAVRAGLEWLGRDLDTPAFLFLHTYEVHHPYTPDPETLVLFDRAYDGSLPPQISEDLIESINRRQREITARDLAHIVATYDAEIRSVDAAFGDFLQGLDELAIRENTLLVFTSDHGEEFGEHGVVGWHSHTLFDELVRVPLLIQFHDGRHAGLSVRAQVRLLDLAPTILAAVGLTVPPSFEGVDLGPVINGLPMPLPAVSQIDSSRELQASLRTQDWKLYPRALFDGDPFAESLPPLLTRVRNSFKRRRWPHLLFDLTEDPRETRDVVASLPDVAEALQPTLEILMAGGEVLESTRADVDETTINQLRALGYID
jgi:arylsulfatase A-like enzyme